MEEVTTMGPYHNDTINEIFGTAPILIHTGDFGLFQRARLYCTRSLVEDIDNIGTLTSMLERLKSSSRRYNAAMESGHAMLGGDATFNIDDESLTPMAARTARRTI